MTGKPTMKTTISTTWIAGGGAAGKAALVFGAIAALTFAASVPALTSHFSALAHLLAVD